MKFRIALYVVFFLSMLISPKVKANIHPSADAQIDAAWDAWNQGKIQQSEKQFREAAALSPKSFRALASLYELLIYRQKYSEAQSLLTQITNLDEDAVYPFLFAVWNGLSLTNEDNMPNADVINIIKSLSEGGKSDKLGILRSLALEKFGTYSLQIGDTVKSSSSFNNLGAIDAWAVIGPFENISESGYERVFPPEGKFDFAAVFQGKNNIPVRWFDIPAIRRDKWIDYEYYYSVGSDIYYANSYVYSPVQQSAYFRIGVSGSLKVFLNDALIIQDEDEKNNGYDTYIAPITLNVGWNRVLIKTGSGEVSRNNFAVRITDIAGYPLEGLRIETKQQSYKPSTSNQSPSLIPNFAEEYFRKYQRKYANDPLAVMLLASTYILNDKHAEAETILLEGLKARPNAPFYLSLLTEAYSRANKTDELQSTRDKLYKTDSLNANGIITRFVEKLQNSEFDAAETLLRNYEAIYGVNPTNFALQIQLYGKKSQKDKSTDAIEKAYSHFPHVWEFVSAFANIVMERSHDRDSVLSILNHALLQNATAEHYWDIAAINLSFSDVKKWDECVRKSLDVQPVACGYYQAAAEQYLTMQKPDSALPFIRRALEINPQAGNFHLTLGHVYRAKNDTSAAIKELQKAILYNPIDFDTRAELRSYQGKPSLFSHFSSAKTDSIIRNAPIASDYPDKEYAILFEEQNRIIYENGASEYKMEMIAKMFTSDAIDTWKEYSITTSNASDGYSIEKAVSIKSDGTEVNADVSGQYIVFKSLEIGDVIQIRWRVRSYNGGRFSNKFWDSYILNGNIPIKYIRFAMLVADSMKFDYRVRNSGIEPKIIRTADGTLYEWTLREDAPIEDEIGMPSWYEIGKDLEFSSIRSWSDIVQWYLELTRSQVKSSREVREQAKLIRDSLGSSANENDIIEAIYTYITQNIRYSSIPFRQSAFIPQKARTVLTTKIGDCKDLSTLFIAMATEFGIKAHYVLVNTFDLGYTRQNPLPTPWAFDHCIVSVEISGKIWYVDLTAPDFALGSVPDGLLGTFALVIRDGVNQPTTLSRSLFIKNNIYRNTKIDLDEDGNANFTVVSERSGWLAAGMRTNYREKSQKEREKMLSETLSEIYQNVEMSELSFDNIANTQENLKYLAKYGVSDLTTEAGSFYVMKMPWSEVWSPSPAFTLEKRIYPLDYPMDADTIQETLIIKLPKGMRLMEIPKTVKKSSPFADYSVQYSNANGIFKAERTLVQKRGYIRPEEYLQFKTLYNSIVKEDGRQVLFKNANEGN